MSRIKYYGTISLVALFAGTSSASATAAGTILKGHVLAPDGKDLPIGAAVTLSSSDTDDQRVCQLAQGHYVFTDVRPGKYALKAEAAGLRAVVQPGIQLKEGADLERDLVLNMGDEPEAKVTDSPAEKCWGVGAMVVFLVAMLITRWFKIAKPSHHVLLGYIDSLYNQVEAAFRSTPNGTQQAVRIALTGQLKTILRQVAGALRAAPRGAPNGVGAQLTSQVTRTKKYVAARLRTAPSDTRGDALRNQMEIIRTEHQHLSAWHQLLFWSQNAENATWVRLHEIEAELATCLSDELVRTQLIIAEPNLRTINGCATGARFGTECATALADHIHTELGNGTPNLQMRRQLLGQALVMIFDARDQRFMALTDWQNKATWLMLVGSTLIAVLGGVDGNIMLFVFGAAGGLLSRLMRAVHQPEFSVDYGASWSTLFLSPMCGALSAWFGVALITLLAHPKVGLLGGMFSLVRWEHTQPVTTMGAAFLLGFSERLFDSLIEAAQNKSAIVVPPKNAPATAPVTVATIAATTPKTA